MSSVGSTPVCPLCGARTRAERIRGRRTSICTACDWGASRAQDLRDGHDVDAIPPPSPPPIWQLAVLWVVALAVLASPIVMIVIMEWGEYAWKILVGFALYLGLANAVTPSVDTGELGWLGGLIDNPFSFHDDWNRMMLFVSLLLMPGKLVGAAVLGTWRHWKARDT